MIDRFLTGYSLLSLCILILLSVSAQAAEPEFQFSRDIEAPPLEQEELLSVTLDADVYEATQDGLHDIRITGGDNDAVPHVLRRARNSRVRTVRRTWTPGAVTARPLDDGGLEIIVTLDEDDLAAGGVRLITPLDNFEKQVRIETSADGTDWQAAGETLIFDYSQYMDVRKDEIPFPQTVQRKLRITIENVTAAQESQLLELTRTLQGGLETSRQEHIRIQRRPFRIDRLQFWSNVEEPGAIADVKQTYPPTSVEVTQDGEEQQTHIIIETRRQPLTRVSIETPERNFSRRAFVQVEDVDGVQTQWRTIGEATLTQFDFKDLQREDLDITFPETRSERLRIVIENRDSPALDVTGAKLIGNEYDVVYLAQPDADYQLVYGDPEASPADYDTAAIQALLRSDYVPRRAKLSDPQSIPASARIDFVNNPAVVIIVIAILVILLGFVLYQASRRLDDT